MTAPTHVLSGLAAAVAAGHLSGTIPSAPYLMALVVGTLAPDIDGAGSITRPGTILRRLIGRTAGDVIDGVFSWVVQLLQLFFSHRGFIHSPFVVALLVSASLYFEQVWLMWFAFGYAAHLAGDACTTGGIPLFSPLSRRRVSLCPLRTGSSMELLIAALLLVFSCTYGWTFLPEHVKETHRLLYEGATEALFD